MNNKYTNRVDMHFHSINSDGAKTNQEILQDSIKKQLLVAICTDHDFINFEMAELFNQNNILSCPGVEITVLNEIFPVGPKYLHLTAYSKVFSNELLNVLSNTMRGKLEKLKAQVRKMKQNGFKIDWDDFIIFCETKGYNQKSLNIYHLSSYVFKNNDNKEKIIKISGNYDQIEFIKEFLRGSGLYSQYVCEQVKEYCPTIKKVCDSFDFETGVMAIAHPQVNFYESKFIEEIDPINIIDPYTLFKIFLLYCISLGVNGIGISSNISSKWLDHIIGLSSRYNLIVTSGTDTHFAGENDTRPKFGTTNPNFDGIDIEIEKFIKKVGI